MKYLLLFLAWILLLFVIISSLDKRFGEWFIWATVLCCIGVWIIAEANKNKS